MRRGGTLTCWIQNQSADLLWWWCSHSISQACTYVHLNALQVQWQGGMIGRLEQTSLGKQLPWGKLVWVRSYLWWGYKTNQVSKMGSFIKQLGKHHVDGHDNKHEEQDRTTPMMAKENMSGRPSFHDDDEEDQQRATLMIVTKNGWVGWPQQLRGWLDR